MGDVLGGPEDDAEEAEDDGDDHGDVGGAVEEFEAGVADVFVGEEPEGELGGDVGDASYGDDYLEVLVGSCYVVEIKELCMSAKSVQDGKQLEYVDQEVEDLCAKSALARYIDMEATNRASEDSNIVLSKFHLVSVLHDESKYCAGDTDDTENSQARIQACLYVFIR